MTDLRDVAEGLAQSARAIDASEPSCGLVDTLNVIARGARDVVLGFDHVGVTVVQHDGVPTTKAFTDGLALEMDSVQYELDQGPCMSVLGQEDLVLVEDLEQQGHNWPRYVPLATRAGVRAQMAVRIAGTEGSLGGLNFYSTGSDTIAPAAPRRARFFATHAAIALGLARTPSNPMAARAPIGQAVGIFVEQLGVTEEQATYYLVRVATVANVEVVDLARQVVEQVNPEGDALNA